MKTNESKYIQEAARLRQQAADIRECAWRADRTSDMRREMARADVLEHRAAELEELYAND